MDSLIKEYERSGNPYVLKDTRNIDDIVYFFSGIIPLCSIFVLYNNKQVAINMENNELYLYLDELSTGKLLKKRRITLDNDKIDKDFLYEFFKDM